MRFFSAEQVHQSLGFGALADAVAAMLRDHPVAPLRHAHALSATDTLLLMPAWSDGAAGTGLGLGVHVTIAPDADKYAIGDGQKDIFGVYQREPSKVIQAVAFDWIPNIKTNKEAWTGGGKLIIKKHRANHQVAGARSAVNFVGVERKLERGFLPSAWDEQVKRDAPAHGFFPFVDDLEIHQGIFSFDFSHPFHRITARADIPSDDVTWLVGISPGVLILARPDGDFAHKC